MLSYKQYILKLVNEDLLEEGAAEVKSWIAANPSKEAQLAKIEKLKKLPRGSKFKDSSGGIHGNPVQFAGHLANQTTHAEVANHLADFGNHPKSWHEKGDAGNAWVADRARANKAYTGEKAHTGAIGAHSHYKSATTSSSFTASSSPTSGRSSKSSTHPLIAGKTPEQLKSALDAPFLDDADKEVIRKHLAQHEASKLPALHPMLKGKSPEQLKSALEHHDSAKKENKPSFFSDEEGEAIRAHVNHHEGQGSATEAAPKKASVPDKTSGKGKAKEWETVAREDTPNIHDVKHKGKDVGSVVARDGGSHAAFAGDKDLGVHSSRADAVKAVIAHHMSKK